MGKHFGELGVHIRGVLYYVLSPHETKKFGKPALLGLANFVTRTRQTYMRWLPLAIITYVIYNVVEAAHKANSRKDPKDYAHEADAEAAIPRWCYKFEEPRPACKDEWVVEKYYCDTNEEPDPEIIQFLEERVLMLSDKAHYAAEDAAKLAKEERDHDKAKAIRDAKKKEKREKPGCP